MRQEHLVILHMLAEGKISPEEAAALLDALAAKSTTDKAAPNAREGAFEGLAEGLVGLAGRMASWGAEFGAKVTEELREGRVPLLHWIGDYFNGHESISERTGRAMSILDTIGNTPMLGLKKMTGANIFAKAEFLNPGGSIKDRIAKYMIEEAEKRGDLRPGMTIMEPTSGNTGIGLALVGVHKGYRVVLVMPENMSEERKKIVAALGAELLPTPAEKSIGGAIEEVRRRAETDPSIFVPQQFENEDNPKIHYLTTGPEIWAQLKGEVDIFVSGLGSGGTLCGVGKFLKEKDPSCRIVAVEPKNVSALLGHEPGLHKIQGIGDGFVPSVLDISLVDEVVEVADDDAIQTARDLARIQGALVGTSSGANVWAARRMAAKYGKDKVIATILADRAERYFSTALI